MKLSKLLSITLLLNSSHADKNIFDYIIVGGGTAGLVVANRLSANPNNTVLVIEAGGSVFNDSRVYPTESYGKALDTNLDWQFKTTDQPHARGGPVTLHAAKAIGGTSTINGMAYTRLAPSQIDAWGSLGNSGWDWLSFFPYYYKSENFSIPMAHMLASGVSYCSSCHGYSGPVKTGWTHDLAMDDLPHLLNKTLFNMGVPPNVDVNSNIMRGFTVYPCTVDNELNVRHDAARAYYWPVAGRKNLVMLPNTIGMKLLWCASNGTNSELKSATSVQTTLGKYVARKEIILAAGSLKTPQLLELSGVGNNDILKKAGITTQIHLPGVGENLHDQINNALSFSSNVTKPWKGSRGYAVYLNATDIFGSNVDTMACSVRTNIRQHAMEIANKSNGASDASHMTTELLTQYKQIFEEQIPMAEIVFYPSGATGLATQYWGLSPMARGSVHIASSDPMAAPMIDPRYWQFGWDREAQIGIAKYVRRLFSTTPLKDIVSGETWPGYTRIPANADDTAWQDWLKSTYRPNYHVVGTTAMKPREAGGVVDARLKVYGTKNVRVVDASVFPSQVAGHLMSTIYAIAEKAAVMIMEDDVRA